MITPEEPRRSGPGTDGDGSADPPAGSADPSGMPPRRARRSRTRRLAISSLFLLAVLLISSGLVWVWVRNLLRSSLPQLSGSIRVAGARAEIRIDRDELGVPTIRSQHHDDLAFGLGFVHAQDRFFQMDAIRRSAAGELAEIIGPGTDDVVLKRDRSVRIFRFRQVARKVVTGLNEADRRWLNAYVAGVNAGLRSLGKKPFEYFLLGAEPAPWLAEDSILALLAMFLDLQGKDYRRESALGVVRDVLPAPLARILCLEGSPDWDAPLQGGPITMPPLPGPEVFDLRKEPARLLRARATRPDSSGGDGDPLCRQQ